jgi:hypothetical protein
MKVRWLVIAAAAVSVLAADAAWAKPRKAKHVRPACIDRPTTFSIEGLLFNPRPQPNGCAPPVYTYGSYVGQDPDPNIRAYMRRDPASGYSGETAQ